VNPHVSLSAAAGRTKKPVFFEKTGFWPSAACGTSRRGRRLQRSHANSGYPCQLIRDVTGAVLVTTPQDVAILDVRKAVTFCRKLSVPILGVVENMSGYRCPKCGEVVDVFKGGGGERMAAEMHTPFLGRIPLDPAVVQSGDMGRPVGYVSSETETARAFARVAERVMNGRFEAGKED